MKRTLNQNIKDFDTFYKTLVAFVETGKPCFSIRDKKEYQSWLDGETIFMSGIERKKNSVYTVSNLKKVFEIIQNSDDIKTKMLNEAVKRERSPIMALMVYSGALVESKD